MKTPPKNNILKMRHSDLKIFIVIVVSILSLPVIGNSQILFSMDDQFLGNDIGRFVRLIDFDGDHDLDVISRNGNMNGDQNAISLWRNDGAGIFKLKRKITLDGYAIYNIAIGNLDQDNDFDLFITTEGPFLTYENDGKGNFKPTENHINTSGYAVALADLNADKNTDILMLYMANYQDRADTVKKTFRIWLNDGDGKFKDTGEQYGGGITANCALGDIDNNGTIDAVTSGWYIADDPSTPCPNKIWLNDGTGVFKDSKMEFFNDAHHIHDLDLCDLDNDNDLDMVISVTTDNQTRVLLNNGKGQFSLKQILKYGWFDKVVTIDIDKDNDVDIVAANGGFGALPNTIWLNDGTAQFTDSGLRFGDDWTWDLDIGDIDGDGDKDIIYANFIAEDGKVVARPNTIWRNDLFHTKK